MAKAEKVQSEATAPPEEKKGAGWKWLIIIFVILLLLGGAGGAGYFFLYKKTDEVKEKPKQPEVSVFWPLDPFIVNLADTQGGRYLKVIMQFEVNNEKTLQELNQLKPKIRDAVLDLLTAKTHRELMEVAGKQQLREEIALRANVFLTSGKINKVYFTEFVIQ